MSESNQNIRPMESKRHFDFESFDSWITEELKQYGIDEYALDERRMERYWGGILSRNPGEIGAVLAFPTIEEVPPDDAA